MVEQYKSGSRYQIIQLLTPINKLQPKTKNQSQIGTTATQKTRKRRSVVRQELASPPTHPIGIAQYQARNRATPSKEGAIAAQS
ncbi:hypothetical protein HMPREF1580_01377 [Gardnerella vaginalis JCP8070]|nr:hypothetical protein HMPREF1580_01377 [Gardnerella vaginalis JCP8070]